MSDHHHGCSPEPTNLSLDIPHSARMYGYYLNGKTNYAPDCEAVRRVATAWLSVFVAARANRAFMRHATRVRAEEQGIRQWLDVRRKAFWQPRSSRGLST